MPVSYTHLDVYKRQASMFGKGTFFLLRAKGESMIEAGISPGDLVLVRKQSEAKDGDICLLYTSVSC